ncbi:DNA helicase, putative [Chitinophaga jiangningensis]|uniref:DNA helicase, putative n=1 Tax=Chitinophaga jiangningensis TaxID=1419482 RepID=A0A1M7CJA2_9BACT|nr:AAA domain-containing protein [Chitinophaga jiangningensis]SHL67352.1 DNA helicase, putative [Chitinophaga jiangningensis]
MDYFKKLQELLKTEREEDRKSYQALTESTSVQDRRAGGLAWYPIAIRGSEMSRGDYLTVEVERTTHHDIPHQLRSGVSAVLFSNHDRSRHQQEGVIAWVGDNRLKITLRTDELPEWADDGKLGIDLLFDDNSYDEMQNALKQAIALADDNKAGRLVRVLTGQATPNFRTDVAPVHIPSLNHSQNEAVNKILQACDVAVVHGPPGTGKTTTLVQAIKALIQQEPQQVLVVAPSNAAVDLLSEKLAEQGLNVLRVGNPARVSERLLSLTLERKMQGHSSLKEVSRLRKQANEFRNMAHKYKRNFGKAEREQRKALFDEARKIIKEVENIEQYVIEDVVAKAQVITATPVGSNHYTVKNLKYRTVIIDEAGQALEPACWIPILKGEKVILAGDHCQLPPTIKSNEAAAAGLATTLLEKVVALYPEAVVLLEEQYRMHATIMGYSSNVFYNDRLRAHASVAAHLLYDNDTPLAFIDTAGCGFDEKTDGTSTTNPEEAAFLFRHLEIMTNALAPHYTPENFPTVAIISPYRQQIEVLKEQLAHYPALQPYKGRITINTIDSFQGQERDMVYISMTRSNTENKIGFLSDIRRMNVAMTRARKKLVIIGDSGTLSQLPFYADFIAYAEAQNSYQSAWEYAE